MEFKISEIDNMEKIANVEIYDNDNKYTCRLVFNYDYDYDEYISHLRQGETASNLVRLEKDMVKYIETYDVDNNEIDYFDLDKSIRDYIEQTAINEIEKELSRMITTK